MLQFNNNISLWSCSSLILSLSAGRDVETTRRSNVYLYTNVASSDYIRTASKYKVLLSLDGVKIYIEYSLWTASRFSS